MSEEEIIRKCNWFIKNDAMYEQSLYDAIQGLLDLYKKEKQKNKELEDKIKEKILDLKDNNNGDNYSLTNVVMILQELLEERN